MESRRFGTTALESSVIGFGTWPIGGARYGLSDDRDAIAAIHAALDAGITCFDTAPTYGNGHAEELLGAALGSRRPKVVIVTKGGLLWDEHSRVIGRNSSKQYLMSLIDDSLRRLNTDYVDLYLIHWPDPATPMEEAMDALEAIVRSGKARYIGVSNFNSRRLREAEAALTEQHLAANQVSFSLFDRRWQRDTFDTCAELGIGVMAYGVLAHGLLTGTFNRSTVFDHTDWRASGDFFGQALLTPENFARNLDVVDRLKAIAARRAMILPQLALAWVLSHEIVTVALVGARNPAEVRDSAGAATVRLTAEELQEIEAVMAVAAGTSTVLPQ